MIYHYHPYTYLMFELLRLYDSKQFNFSLIIVYNNIPIQYNEDNFENILDQDFWFSEKNSYCLVYFETHLFTIKPDILDNDDSLKIIVTNKNNGDFILDYNTLDYRIIYDWMKQYFN